jgi:rhodanese-related sulfurtransferase
VEWTIAIALAIAVVSLGFYFRRKALKQEREELRLSVLELSKRMARGDKLHIVDLRHPLDVLAAPQLIPGAMPISPQDVEQRIEEIPREAEVVLYCTCPDESSSLNAYRKMKDHAFRNVKVLTGGLPAWKQAKLPLQDLYPELEQQMRQRATRS